MNKFQIKKCYPYNLYKFTTQFTFFTIPTYMQHLMCDFAVLPIGNNFSCAKEFPFIFDFRIHITSEDDVFSEKDALLIKHAKTLAIEDSYHEIDISFLMMFENLEELYFIDSCIVGDFFEIIKTLKHLKKLEVYKSGIYSPSREPTFDLMNRLQKVLPNCEVEYV